jgi:DNA polymerase-3 subunit alpha
MDPASEWLKQNQQEILKKYNFILFKELWDKYASGTISHWEMEALCFYYNEHELANVDKNKYGIVDYSSLPDVPEVEYYFRKTIPIYKLYKIIGTVLAKNDNKSTVTLLTTTGVVNVKFTKDYYSIYNKQISEIMPDGTKKVMERGWFKRGNMLMVTGFRREGMFVGKTYKNTASHQLYKITEVKDKDIIITHDRYSAKEIIEEEDNYE